jgi:hypothetical protein
MSIDERRALVVGKLRERGFPRFAAGFLASGPGRIKRRRPAQ